MMQDTSESTNLVREVTDVSVVEMMDVSVLDTDVSVVEMMDVSVLDTVAWLMLVPDPA